MRLNFLAILIGTCFSQLSLGQVAHSCGPKPEAPISYCANIPNLPADQRIDCEHSHEIALVFYDFRLNDWNLCVENHNQPHVEPCYWPSREIEYCSTLRVPIYGGNYFTGERKSTTYNPDDSGWYCDEVYVPETTNQYYDYPDYDGTNCEVYLGQPSRIYEQEKCEIRVVRSCF